VDLGYSDSSEVCHRISCSVANGNLVRSKRCFENVTSFYFLNNSVINKPVLIYFTARHCMQCGTSAMTLYPSVCPSQASVVSKRLDESSWFLAWRLRSTYPTLSCKEIGVSPKKMSTSLWTQKFSPGQLSRPRCQQTYRRSSLLTVDHTYDDRRVVAVYCTSVDCNTLTPLLRFVVDLLYKLFLRLYSS